MPESGDSSTSKEDKEVVYYGALVNAWIMTKMEKDKSILTLSVGGIGVLITLLSIIKSVTCIQLWMFGLGGLFFLISAICLIYIFGKNSSLIEGQIVNGKTDEKTESWLKSLDAVAMLMFLLGVFLSLCIALTIGWRKIEEGKMGSDGNRGKLEISMSGDDKEIKFEKSVSSDDKKTKMDVSMSSDNNETKLEVTMSGDDKKVKLDESLGGISKVSPDDSVKNKSLSDIGKIKPADKSQINHTSADSDDKGNKGKQ